MNTYEFHYYVGESAQVQNLPTPENELLPGLAWGDPGVMFTPAYWLSQYWMAGLDKVKKSPYTTSSSLAEELTFCLLGGFGIKEELATAVFYNCKQSGLIAERDTNPSSWQKVLLEPVRVNGKDQRYRYPNQKSTYLAGSMQYLLENQIDNLSGIKLRNKLLEISGIGLKTAGWITRNYSDSDDVAILDIHLVRAGVISGFIDPGQTVEKHYFEMEKDFINYCSALNVRPASLDCLIWDQMRELGKIALDIYKRLVGVTPKLKTMGRPKQLPLTGVSA